MPNNWNAKRAEERIATRFEEVRDVTIVDYTKEMSLENIPTNKAYRMHAAHVYVDILNVVDMLNVTNAEGEICHQRTLRFLNLHYRAVHRILTETESRRVDFHNQRLHAVVAKPYGNESEGKRVSRAVAIAQLISDVLAETGDADEHIPNAKVRVGVDTGEALVVNNGRRGGREPLFLGRPANHAAKCASAGTTTGIFLTNEARSAIGLPELDNSEDRTTALTAEQIAACQDEAALGVSKEDIVEAWKKEQNETPLGAIEFSRPSPPLRNLDIDNLSLANTKRFEGVSLYGDIDGFTAFVDSRLAENPMDVVRTLHVLRSEFDQVVSSDFQGRRIRFVGDCIHGVLLEGTAYTTDGEATVSNAVLCAGALRSSFAVALKFLRDRNVDADELGLAVGFDYGPISISRLGMKGDKVRCAIGRCVPASETEQRRCDGVETAMGLSAHDTATEAAQQVFHDERIARNLDYDSAVTELSAEGDSTAKAIETAAYQLSRPAVVPALSEPLRPHSA